MDKQKHYAEHAEYGNTERVEGRGAILWLAIILIGTLLLLFGSLIWILI